MRLTRRTFEAEVKPFTNRLQNRTIDKGIFPGNSDRATFSPIEAAKDDKAPIDSEDPILVGKVVEAMDSGHFTYLNLERDGKRAWSAVLATPVAIGDEIELEPGSAMGKFTSISLNRTFNSIYIASGVRGSTAQKAGDSTVQLVGSCLPGVVS